MPSPSKYIVRHWSHDREEWIEAAFCTNCGAPLRQRQKAKVRRKHIDPYPCGDPPPKLRLPVAEIIWELKQVAMEHPYLFSVGAIAAGIGAILAAPALVTIGTGIMWNGGIITATGFLSAAFVEKREAERWIAVGLLAPLAKVANPDLSNHRDKEPPDSTQPYAKFAKQVECLRIAVFRVASFECDLIFSNPRNVTRNRFYIPQNQVHRLTVYPTRTD